MDAMASGLVVKVVIPSMEWSSSSQKEHFVSPATRFTFSNGIHSVLNPTRSYKPLVKRWYSGMHMGASATFRLIILKSLAPSTNFVGDTMLMSR